MSRLSQVVTSTTIILWLTFRTCSAQSRDVSFGVTRSYSVPEWLDRLESTNRQGSFFGWNPTREKIALCQFDSTGTHLAVRSFSSATPFDSVLVARASDGSLGDFYLVDRGHRLVSSVHPDDQDSLRALTTVHLQMNPDVVAAGDCNNDGSTDLLVADKNIPGIVPLLRDQKGGLVVGKTIAQELVVGSMAVVDLNGDRLNDIVLYDWVKSELHLLYGVGRGRFLDQSVFPVKGAVNAIHSTTFQSDGIVDFLMQMKNKHDLQIWLGTEMGDYQQVETLSSPDEIISVSIGDVNDDGWNDICALTSTHGMLVWLNDGAGGFGEATTFGTNPHARDLLLVSDGRTEGAKAVISTKQRSVIDVFSSDKTVTGMDSVTVLACGKSPAGISIRDINNDGIPDIVAAMEGSQSLAIYFGRKDRPPAEPGFANVSGNPHGVTFHATQDSIARFIVSYEGIDSISYVSFDLRGGSVSNAVIPTEGMPVLLRASDLPSGTTEFATLNMSGNVQSLSFYRQIAPSSFVEENFRLSHPALMVGAAVGDFNRDGSKDIIYLYRQSDTSSVELGVSRTDSVQQRRMIATQEFPIRTSPLVWIWLGDIDGDDTVDIVTATSSAGGEMSVARGLSDGGYATPVQVAAHLGIAERTQVQLVDVDHDGFLDLIVKPVGKDEIGWLRGKRGFRFFPYAPLVAATESSQFRVEDVDADGTQDLVVSCPEENRLLLFNGKYLFGRH